MTEQPIFDDLLEEFLAAGHSEPIPMQQTRQDQNAAAQNVAAQNVAAQNVAAENTAAEELATAVAVTD